MNFRAACKGWLAAAPLSEYPPQFPFLLEHETSSRSYFKLYSFHTDKTLRIRVPEAHKKLFCGQSQGYLVICSIISLTLINPFTNCKAVLPLPFNGFEFYRPLHVSPDFIRNSDDVVIYMNLGTGGRFVGFWKNEKSEWDIKGHFEGRVEAYHRGRIFFSNFNNYSTTIVDLNTGNKLDVRLPSNSIQHDFFCLGEGAGAFLGVRKNFYCTKYENMSLEKCWFEVYRLDEEQKPPCWVKLSDIGDLIIFLNSDGTGFCLSASDFDGISGNCIYFLEMIHCSSFLVGLYELGKDGSEVIGKLKSKGTWIVPNLY